MFLLIMDKLFGVFGKEPQLLLSRKELKIEEATEIWKRLIAQGWIRTNLFDQREK